MAHGRPITATKSSDGCQYATEYGGLSNNNSITKYGSLVRPDTQIVALRAHCAKLRPLVSPILIQPKVSSTPWLVISQEQSRHHQLTCKWPEMKWVVEQTNNQPDFWAVECSGSYIHCGENGSGLSCSHIFISWVPSNCFEGCDASSLLIFGSDPGKLAEPSYRTVLERVLRIRNQRNPVLPLSRRSVW